MLRRCQAGAVLPLVELLRETAAPGIQEDPFGKIFRFCVSCAAFPNGRMYGWWMLDLAIFSLKFSKASSKPTWSEWQTLCIVVICVRMMLYLCRISRPSQAAAASLGILCADGEAAQSTLLRAGAVPALVRRGNQVVQRYNWKTKSPYTRLGALNTWNQLVCIAAAVKWEKPYPILGSRKCMPWSSYLQFRQWHTYSEISWVEHGRTLALCWNRKLCVSPAWLLRLLGSDAVARKPKLTPWLDMTWLSHHEPSDIVATSNMTQQGAHTCCCLSPAELSSQPQPGTIGHCTGRSERQFDGYAVIVNPGRPGQLRPWSTCYLTQTDNCKPRPKQSDKKADSGWFRRLWDYTNCLLSWECLTTSYKFLQHTLSSGYFR